MAQEKTRPVHEIRLGRIRAALWENSTEKGTRHNVTVTRLIQGWRTVERLFVLRTRRPAAGHQGARSGSHLDLRASVIRQFGGCRIDFDLTDFRHRSRLLSKVDDHRLRIVLTHKIF
jgi:hypothetical protein